jgi:hypothetical protein
LASASRRGLHREQRCVLAFHAPWHDATGHRQRVDQEPLGTPHQRKGIAVELAVVDELIARRALESGHLEQQLREIR